MHGLGRSLLLIGVFVFGFDGMAVAQADLKASLERLDRNENGLIEPEEITPLSRPYLENLAKTSRMSLREAHSIDRYQKAARVYFAIKNGVMSDRLRPDTTPKTGTVEFGILDGETYLPGFGLPIEGTYPVTEDDVRTAAGVVRRYDRDRDGKLSRAEAEKAKWTYRDPFESDFNRDDFLSELELQQRFARRRILSGNTKEISQQRERNRAFGKDPWSQALERDNGNPITRRSRSWSRQPGTPGYLASSLVGNFDLNRNGRLDIQEAKNLGLPLGQIDTNRDSEISRDEMTAFVEKWQDQSDVGSLDELPDWFFELDSNRDTQIAMSEFTDEWTEEKIEQFTLYDANGDGMITIAEFKNSKALSGGVYRADSGEVIPPKKTIISEIEVTDDFLIGDLNIQVNITHTHCEYLEGYLIGPDGQQIELFTNIGGSGDHFEDTIFDDQSSYPITKMKPPFRGVFQPESLARKQTSLSHYNSQSIAGVWQLMIRGSRNDRFGMLHHWSIMVKPQDQMGESIPIATQDGAEPAAAKPVNQARGTINKGGNPWIAMNPKSEDAIRQAHQSRMTKINEWRDSMMQKMASGELGERESAQFKTKLEGLDKYIQSMEKQRDAQLARLRGESTNDKSDKEQMKQSKQALKEIKKASRK